jgi:hypothetical protein
VNRLIALGLYLLVLILVALMLLGAWGIWLQSEMPLWPHS